MTKETNTNQKAARQRALNRINLLSSILVFGTGLILFTQFHVVENPYPTEWHGLEKSIWLVIHQLSAIAFFIGLILHIQLHWKYLKTVIRRWSSNLPKKTRSKIRMQNLFLLVTVVVLTTGFYPWIAMPGATIQMERYDLWIDIHNQAGLLYLVGMSVHIIRRWRRIFRFTKGTQHSIKRYPAKMQQKT